MADQCDTVPFSAHWYSHFVTSKKVALPLDEVLQKLSESHSAELAKGTWCSAWPRGELIGHEKSWLVMMLVIVLVVLRFVGGTLGGAVGGAGAVGA